MGYESKIIVAERSDLDSTAHKGSLWCDAVCIYDMSVCHPLSQVFRVPEKHVFFYAIDGNTRIKEDACGSLLRVCSVPELIDWLESMERRDKGLSKYRRYKPLMAMLKSFDLTQWHDLICIHYGY